MRKELAKQLHHSETCIKSLRRAFSLLQLLLQSILGTILPDATDLIGVKRVPYPKILSDKDEMKPTS